MTEISLIVTLNKQFNSTKPNRTGPGLSILCWLAAPVAMFFGNLQIMVIRLKSVIKYSSVISFQIGVMSDQLRMSLYMDMSQIVI